MLEVNLFTFFFACCRAARRINPHVYVTVVFLTSPSEHLLQREWHSASPVENDRGHWSVLAPWFAAILPSECFLFCVGLLNLPQRS